MKQLLLSALIALMGLAPCYGFELIILGDSRSGEGNRDFQKTRQVINDAIAYTEDTYDDLVGIVMTGDYVSSGTSDEEWNAWIDANEGAFDYPVYPCLGNHDDESSGCEWWDLSCENAAYLESNYYRAFNVDRWWSTDIEGIHLVSLDSNLEGFDPQTQRGDFIEESQYNWFLDDLEQNQHKPTVVVWHEPAYASYTWFGQGHGSNIFMRNRYVSLCEQYGVKVILCGHNHWYERVTVNGIKHITTGGGGAPLLPVSPFQALDRVEGSEVNRSGYHFCVASIEDGVMQVDVIRFKTHWIMDSFEIPLNAQ